MGGAWGQVTGDKLRVASGFRKRMSGWGEERLEREMRQEHRGESCGDIHRGENRERKPGASKREMREGVKGRMESHG